MSDPATCAYCMEEMNVGASVCHACARRQPVSKSVKILLMWAVLVLGAFGSAIYFVIREEVQHAKIDRLAVCAQFKSADKGFTAKSLSEDINAMMATGLSWDDAYSVSETLLGCKQD